MASERARPGMNQTPWMGGPGLAAAGSAAPAQSRSKDFPLRGSEELRYGSTCNPDEAGDLSKQRIRRTRVVADMIGEIEEMPLLLRQRSERLPSLQGRALYRADSIRRLHVFEESAQGGEDLFRRQEDHASLAGPDRGDLEGYRPGPLLAEEASKSLGQTPFDPCDILSASSVRREDLKARNPISTRDRTRLPPSRRLLFEWALPLHADDEGVRLRAQGKGLEDLDGTVVAEETIAQDLEVVEERRGHGELEPFHRVWLTGKPEPTYTCGP